ncbi:hypothetical protein THIOM_000316 [Candidatus Thiomargarita nelsonii]|uniref:Uncharacterized protein n=1 Tax=Candidatus Thiomargarita nelsonii TaxID=1003181 RepID=A0A176S753_9GAMM|nr:hypothetical protein THIOM_000316 [Candidatus Thiomargarita nelsonii]
MYNYRDKSNVNTVFNSFISQLVVLTRAARYGIEPLVHHVGAKENQFVVGDLSPTKSLKRLLRALIFITCIKIFVAMDMVSTTNVQQRIKTGYRRSAKLNRRSAKLNTTKFRDKSIEY